MSSNILDLFNNSKLLSKKGNKIHLKIAKGSITWDKLGDDVKERILNNEVFLNTLYSFIEELVSKNNLIPPGMKQYKVNLIPARGVEYSSYQTIVFEGQRYEVEVYIKDNNWNITSLTASMANEDEQHQLTITTLEEKRRYKISAGYVTGNIEINPITIANNFIVTRSFDENLTYSNNITTLDLGGEYEVVISPKTGYYINPANINAEMDGGGAIFVQSYTNESYLVHTSSVTGNIRITAEALGKQFDVSLSADNGKWKKVSSDTYIESDTYTYGSGPVVYHFENNQNYSFNNFSEELPEGVSWDSQAKNLTIENILAEVSIHANTIYVPNNYYINKGNNFTNLDLYKDEVKITGNSAVFTEHESFYIKVRVPVNYHITTNGTPSVTIGATTTAMSYDNSNPSSPFYYYHVSNLAYDIFVNGVARSNPKLTISGNAFDGDFVATVDGVSKGHNEYLEVGKTLSITFTLQAGYEVQDRHFISNYHDVEFDVLGRVYSAEFTIGEDNVNFVLEATAIVYPTYWGKVEYGTNINDIDPTEDNNSFTTASIQTTEIDENGFYIAFPTPDKSFPTITGTQIAQTYTQDMGNNTSFTDTTINGKAYKLWVYHASLPNATVGDRINISFN